MLLWKIIKYHQVNVKASLLICVEPELEICQIFIEICRIAQELILEWFLERMIRENLVKA